MNNIKKASLIIGIITIVIGLFIVLMSIFEFQILVDIICVIIGLGIIITNVFPLVTYSLLMNRDSKYSIYFIMALFGVLCGIFFIFFHNLVMHIIVCVFLLLLPLIRIAKATDKKTQIKKELPLFILGVIVIFNVVDVLGQVMMVIVGSFIITLGVFITIYTFLPIYRKRANNTSTIIDAEFKEVDPEIIGELDE